MTSCRSERVRALRVRRLRGALLFLLRVPGARSADAPRLALVARARPPRVRCWRVCAGRRAADPTRGLPPAA